VVIPVANVARSVLHALRFFSICASPALMRTQRSKSQNRDLIFLFLVCIHETNHDFVEPVSYVCMMPLRFPARRQASTPLINRIKSDV